MRPAPRTQNLFVATLSAVAVATLTLGCGEAPQQAPISSLPNGQIAFPPGTYSPGGTVSNQTLNALYGTYFGKLNQSTSSYSSSYNTFDYSVTLSGLSTAPVSNDNPYQSPTYGKLDMDVSMASAPGGHLKFSAYLILGFNGYTGTAGGGTTYSFTSNAIEIPELSDQPFSIEVILTLGTNGQFDPTQSRILIRECVFAQALVCSNYAQGLWFDQVLGKR